VVWQLGLPDEKQSSPPPVGTEATAEAPAVEPAAEPVTGALTVQTVDEGVELPIRAHAFAAKDGQIAAEGVTLPTAGEVEFTSRLSGGKVAQRLLGAALVREGKVVRTLARSDASSARTDRTSKSSSGVTTASSRASTSSTGTTAPRWRSSSTSATH